MNRVEKRDQPLSEEDEIRRERRFSPAQFLAVSFVSAIILGAALLLMPFSTQAGGISLIDALFTSTSAVCVTGLTVQSTSAYFSSAGQAVIMILFQLGGLGIMTFSTLVLLVAGKRISIKDRLIIKEGYHPASPENVQGLVRNIFFYTLAIEIFGAALFLMRWKGGGSLGKAAFQSLFHSVSAFCNAGFSLFSDSFEGYMGDIWVNGVLIVLIVLGGLGFLVLHESGRKILMTLHRKPFRVSLHTRMVLSITISLILISFLLFFFLEWHHSLGGMSMKEKISASLFQSVTPRTAGFNTVNMKSLGHGAVSLIILLMFIGASPGSAGGGVKTSTIGVLLAFLKSKISARESVSLFRRTLPSPIIMKAFSLIFLAISVIFFSSLAIFIAQPQFSMREVFFEVFSAFGTVGLSMGITPDLSPFSKMIIILTMYIGRMGPLTLLYAFSRRRAFGKYEYVEESVMIG